MRQTGVKQYTLRSRGFARVYVGDDSKISDTLSWIRKDIVRYNAVPYFSCSVNVWTEPEEALKLLGLL